MKPITIIGKNSYLARHFLATKVNSNIIAVPHDAVGDIKLSQTECIINFAYPGAYMTDTYEPANDVDRAIIDRLKGSDIHFIMISSRKVYDQACPCPWDETSTLAGQDVYGQNKVVTEEYIREHRAGQHTILRLGNIIETEPGRHTFMGIALDTLKREGRIKLNAHPGTKRDFLPVAKFAAALARVIQERPVGTYNLASGLQTSVGDVASWIIEGFGAGQVVSTDNAQRDAFVLDVVRLQSIIGPICTRSDIREACMESGRRLKNG